MKNKQRLILLLLIAVFTVSGLKAQQGHGALPENKNIFLNRDYWKANPSIEQIKADMAKGNDVAQLNAHAMDATTYAILEGADNETIKFLIAQDGNSVNKNTHDERIYAHWAAYKSNAELLEYLMKEGSNPKALDHFNHSIINFAAVTAVNDPKIYDIAEKYGVDFKTPNKRGANVLLSALGNMKDDTKLLGYLLSKGLTLDAKDNDGNNAYVYAVQSGNIDLLKHLEDKGLSTTNSQAVFFAARPGRGKNASFDVFNYLAEKQFNFNAKDDEGRSVIQYLAGNEKNVEIVKFLMNKGISTTEIDHEGNTPLMSAVFRGGLNMVKTLQPTKEEINHKNKKGETAFLRAAKLGKPDVLAYLIKNGANTSITNKTGENAYFYLIDRYSRKNKTMFTEKLALLQPLSIDASTTNSKGETLLHSAVAKNDTELISTLLGMGIDINQADKNGLTPLHKAVQVAKNLKMIEFLIQKGAKKSLKTAFGETPFDLANENEFLTKHKINLSILK